MNHGRQFPGLPMARGVTGRSACGRCRGRQYGSKVALLLARQWARQCPIMNSLTLEQQLSQANLLLQQENERLRRENAALQQRLEQAETLIQQLQVLLRKYS